MTSRDGRLHVDVSQVDHILSGRLITFFQARPLLVDIVTASACLIVQVGVLIIASPDPFWPSVIIAVASCGLLMWRRRLPVAMLVMVVVLGSLGGLVQNSGAVFMLPATIMLYTLATTCSLWTVGIGYLITVGIPMLAELGRFLVTAHATAPTLLDPVALVGLAIGLGARGATQRREALAELMNERLATARMVERQRITAEMHDVVAHSLTTMVALADGASSGWEKHPERSTQALIKLGDVGRTALTEMQRILQVLREDDLVLDDELHRSGHNVPDLEELVDVYRIAGLPVRLTWKGRSVADDAVLTTTVYRIVNEALTNALRYAKGATRVEVDLEVAGPELTINVSDNGRAAPDVLSQGVHRGLVAITERAAAHGGTSTAGPRPEGGWTTTAVLKVGDNAQERSKL